MDVVVLATADIPRTFDDKVPQDYADDFYDNGGYGIGENHSGMLVLIDMNNKFCYITTAGDMIGVMTDARIDALLDELFKYYPALGTGCISLLHMACVDLQASMTP